MLTARPTNEEKPGLVSLEWWYDIFHADKQVGSLEFKRRTGQGAFTIDGRACTVDRLTDQPVERVYQALIRMSKGGEKPPANPWALKDASGQVLAQADLAVKTGMLDPGFAVSRGHAVFAFRQPSYSVVFRPYQLYRQGSDESLGSVGREKTFTRTLQMNLPAGFDAPFQLFLLVLLLQKIQAQKESD